MAKINPNLTVVIPSLGNDCLYRTIESIFKGSMAPKNIIVVIPSSNKSLIKEKEINRVTFCFVQIRGQVKQRAYGFRMAKTKFVMQLDDDVLLESNAILNLCGKLQELGKNSSFAPVFLDKFDHKSIYKNRAFIIDFLSFLFLGAKWGSKKYGTINSAGSVYGYQSNKNSLVNEVEWHPGACVLHYKNNLILQDYYPFQGKAYGEDIIHSILLRKNNVKLYALNNAFCYIDPPALDSNYSIDADFKVRKLINKLRGKSLIPVFLWFLYKKLFWSHNYE